MTNTTSNLLKQALEALQNVAQELHHIDAGPVKELDAIIAEVESASAALTAFVTAFDALSEYDKAIHAIAPYLPEGWVCQSEGVTGGVHHFWSDRKPEPLGTLGSGSKWSPDWAHPQYGAVHLWVPMHNFPRCPDWRKSLRRITHNSDGTVTVERG